MLIPAGHRVLIKPEDIKETDEIYASAAKAGIEIVQDKQTKRAEKASQIIGTIIAVGINAWKAFDEGDAWAKVGDRVTYSKYGGKFIEDPETKEEYIILNDEDITCIIKDKENE